MAVRVSVGEDRVPTVVRWICIGTTWLGVQGSEEFREWEGIHSQIFVGEMRQGEHSIVVDYDLYE